jgi:hypothetical protein
MDGDERRLAPFARELVVLFRRSRTSLIWDCTMVSE